MADHEGTGVQIPPLEGVPDDAGADGSDPGGWGARLVGKLDLAIGKLGDVADGTSNTARQLAKLRQEARQQPALVKLSTAFTWSSAAGAQMCQQGGTGAGVLIGGPEIGQQWSVVQIIVGGSTLAAVVTGTAWFLVAAAPPNEQSITSVMDSATTLPSVAWYSPGQFYLAPNEALYMVITGGTNGAQYVGSVAYQNSPFVPRSTEITM